MSLEADVFDVEVDSVIREEDRAESGVQTVNPEAEWSTCQGGLVIRRESSGQNEDVAAALPVVCQDRM